MSRATEIDLPLSGRLRRAMLLPLAKVPPGVMSVFTRWTKINSDGDRLAPEMALVGWSAEHLPGMGLGGEQVGPSRAQIDATGAILAEKLPPMAIEEDLEFDGPAGRIAATRYRAGTRSDGLIVFLHGGGFVLGSRASHDGLARRLAIGTGLDVLSVDYRMAPEAPFPAAVEDAVAAFRFAAEAAPKWGIPPEKIVVAGDSAGGNLAAVIAQQVRGEAVTPAMQLLIYPVTDANGDTGSRREFVTGHFLTKERMDWFIDHYVPNAADRSDPRCSPLSVEDLAGLPPAHVVVAGFDPLRDEGLEYARRLQLAGVPVTVQREGSLIHGFANMTMLSGEARAAVDRMNEAVRKVVH